MGWDRHLFVSFSSLLHSRPSFNLMLCFNSKLEKSRRQTKGSCADGIHLHINQLIFSNGTPLNNAFDLSAVALLFVCRCYGTSTVPVTHHAGRKLSQVCFVTHGDLLSRALALRSLASALVPNGDSVGSQAFLSVSPSSRSEGREGFHWWHIGLVATQGLLRTGQRLSITACHARSHSSASV